jgi:hypothetical protein
VLRFQKERDRMEKSFYYPATWQEVSYLREALAAMDIPFVIEQDDWLELTLAK